MKQNKFAYLSGYTDAFNVKRRTEDGVRQTHQESRCSLVDWEAAWRIGGESVSVSGVYSKENAGASHALW